MIWDLSNPRANEYDGHYDALLRYARAYLLEKAPGVTGRVRLTSSPRGTYEISDKTDFQGRHLVLKQGAATWTINEPALWVYIDGQPAPQLNVAEGRLVQEPYRQIIPADILPENLGRSYSGLCLAGRAAGAEPSRKICAKVRFRSEAGEYGLDQLLSIHGWSATNISRVSFFNSLTKRIDRISALPSLVVADGDVPFLQAIRNSEWGQTDIIGVVHRTMERDRLEALGNEAPANQWYTDDVDMLCELPPLVRGISISIRRRRRNDDH